TGKNCGSDGCGGTCGTCSSEQTCTNGVCVASCVPDCSGKTCGSDGCGGKCGSCSGGLTCDQSGAYVKACTSNNDCPTIQCTCGGQLTNLNECNTDGNISSCLEQCPKPHLAGGAQCTDSCSCNSGTCAFSTQSCCGSPPTG